MSALDARVWLSSDDPRFQPAIYVPPNRKGLLAAFLDGFAFGAGMALGAVLLALVAFGVFAVRRGGLL